MSSIDWKDSDWTRDEDVLAIKPSWNNLPGDDTVHDSGQNSGSTSFLCVECKKIFQQWDKVIIHGKYMCSHHGSLSVLEMSAKDGCSLCAQFLLSMENEELALERERTSSAFEDGSKQINGSVRISQRIHGDRAWSRRWQLDLGYEFVDQTNDDTWDTDSPRAVEEYGESTVLSRICFTVEMIPASTLAINRNSLNTRDSLLLSKQWLNDCRQNHIVCGLAKPHVAPTRLLSVKNGIRLKLAADIGHCPDYATLSHCWGDLKFTTLTNKNIELFQERVPDAALPNTFKDAVHVIQELGIDYLWIDSLCIIQDDAGDWEREATLMSTVYGGSTVNIAAAGAVDGSVGCFFDRKRSWRCQIEINENEQPTLYDCVPSRLFYQCLKPMPLRKRGWAVQEQLLPSRALHFTSTQVFWECHRKLACETFPFGFPATITYGPHYEHKESITRPFWEDIVQIYTSCELTRSTDKLVAISGIARHIQLQTRDDYVAGLWRQDLEYQLCWKVARDDWRSRKVPYYRAPTWSWASTDAKIITFYQSGHRRNPVLNIKVLQVNVIPVDNNHLGKISAATLRISSQHLFCATAMGKGNLTFAGRKFHMRLSYDGLNDRPRMLHLLPIVGYGGNTDIQGLLLEQTNQVQDQYRRVGQFELYPFEARDFEKITSKIDLRVKRDKSVDIETGEVRGNTQIIDLV